MINLRKVYFPLRSNVGWFKSLDLQKRISNRIKHAILLYDQLLIEDGTYFADIFETGSFCPYFPAGKLEKEERIIEFERDIESKKIALNFTTERTKITQPLLQGKTLARFKIDYYNIFKDLELNALDFIKFIQIDSSRLPNEVKQSLNHNNHIDKQIFKDHQEHYFIKDLVIKNLNYDLLTSILIQSPIVLDEIHSEYLNQKAKYYNSNKISPVKEELVLRNLIDISVPNFNDITINDVIELRKEKIWHEFREFIGKLSDKLSSELDILSNPKELESAVNSIFVKEFLIELEKKYPSNLSTGIDLALGITSLIPGYGLVPTSIGIGKSLYEQYKNRSGWFAYLMKIKQKSLV